MCTTGRQALAKSIPPEIQASIEAFFQNFNGALDPVREDLVAALEDETFDPADTESVRTLVEQHVGEYTQDIVTVYQEGTADGAEAGRALAGRRDQLAIAFDIVPQSTLNEFADWSEEIVNQEVLSTITDDSVAYIRAAHEEGLAIPDIADAVNDELFDNRLQDYVAERNARTATISSSNAGQHSAFQDADSVVAEEWLATSGSRTRDTHAAANGQIVGLDSTFTVGGHAARYPGDPSLPASEVINCRCVPLSVMESDLTEGELETIRNGGRIWR